jgi:Asp/Glu/hydantoin racemase
MNILDDSLIADIIADGRVTKAVRRRLYTYYDAACDSGADVILNTCSSIGDAAEAAREVFPIPILRIDEPMARMAVGKGTSIGVLATLRTTLEPTMRLLQTCAHEAGVQVRIIEAVADGAFAAITQGDGALHDSLVAEAAKTVARQCDVLVLAQGSMARMEQPLAEYTGRLVLSSPRLGVEMVKEVLEGRWRYAL